MVKLWCTNSELSWNFLFGTPVFYGIACSRHSTWWNCDLRDHSALKQTETKGKDQNRPTHKYTYTIALLWNSLLALHQGCFKYSRASERKGRHRLSSSPVVTLFCAAGSLFLNFMVHSVFPHTKKRHDCTKKCRSSFKDWAFSRLFSYIRNSWNRLDLVNLLVYACTFVLRVATSSAAEVDSRALLVGGYLYGLNTMILTFRVFGQLMETVKGLGTIQIALLSIISDVAIILWQFAATILAFSFAMTKVYMSERSIISQGLEADQP